MRRDDAPLRDPGERSARPPIRTESQIRIVLQRDFRWIVLLLVVVVAFLVFRWQVVEVFHIPSPSMEPMLVGHPESGDKVLVNKLAFRVTEPRRWQVVVFERPGDAEPYVKRLVGLPGERVHIDDGDVLVDDEVPDRSDAVLEEMLVPVAATPASAVDMQAFWETDGPVDVDAGRSVTLDGGRGAVASMRSRRDVTDDPLDSGAAPPGEASSPVNDLVISLDAEFEPLAPGGGESIAGTLRVAVHRGSAEAVWLEVEPRGAMRLRRGDALLDAFEPSQTGFVPGTPFSISLSTVDRRLRLLANGVELVRRREKGPDAESAHKRAGFHRRNNCVTLTATQTKVRLSNFLLERDIYYSADGEEGVARPVRLGPDEYYFLGDNSRVSKDSRFWMHPIRRESLVGAAFMIVWPPGRIRMLD